MMKRKLLILSVLVICAATLAAGTLAYYNAEDTAHNVITTGGVKIAIQEWADAQKQTSFENLTGVLPGASVTKIAEVKNTGASEAWIRVKVVKTIQLAGTGTADPAMIELDLNTADWTLAEDGYLYCNKAVKPGECTAPIFTTVSFRGEMGNEYQNASVQVDVLAQGVQTANNGSSAQAASGWPADKEANQ